MTALAPLITLHYALKTQSGEIVVSTFAQTPATLTLGQGQLAPALEDVLRGMKAGDKQSMTFPAETIFGPYRAELRRFFSAAFIQQELGREIDSLQLGDVLDVSLPQISGGAKVSAYVSQIDAAGAYLDFNHPLARQALIFEAQVISVL